MKKISLQELEKRLELYIYKEQFMLALKGAILKLKPLAVVLLGDPTKENPNSIVDKEVIFFLEKKECPTILRKKTARIDEFGILNISFLDISGLLQMVKEKKIYAREIIEKGTVIYTKNQNVWEYICKIVFYIEQLKKEDKKHQQDGYNSS